MKTLRFIGMGLFAVLLSFTIVSCGDDEDEQGEVTPVNPDPKAKRLVQIVEVHADDGDFDTDYYNFEYDNQGRLILVTEYESDGDVDDIYKVKYSGNSIIQTEEAEYDGDFVNVITLNCAEGKVFLGTEEYSGFSYAHNYNYNSSNYLTEARGGLGYTTLTWSGNKLMEAYEKVDGYEDDYTFVYDGKTCNGPNPVFVLFFSNIMYESEAFPLIANPELIGLQTNQLPKTAYFGNDVANFTYEFDNDGYLKTFIETENYNSDDHYKYYAFVWE